jgi:hypothetical protein
MSASLCMPGIVVWSCRGSDPGRPRSVSQARIRADSGPWAAPIRSAIARMRPSPAFAGANAVIRRACAWWAIIICTNATSRLLYVDPSGASTRSESVTAADSPGRPGRITRTGGADEAAGAAARARSWTPERAAATVPPTARAAAAATATRSKLRCLVIWSFHRHRCPDVGLRPLS